MKVEGIRSVYLCVLISPWVQSTIKTWGCQLVGPSKIVVVVHKARGWERLARIKKWCNMQSICRCANHRKSLKYRGDTESHGYTCVNVLSVWGTKPWHKWHYTTTKHVNDTIEIIATSINMCNTNAGIVPSFNWCKKLRCGTHHTSCHFKLLLTLYTNCKEHILTIESTRHKLASFFVGQHWLRLMFGPHSNIFCTLFVELIRLFSLLFKTWLAHPSQRGRGPSLFMPHPPWVI